MILPNLKSQIIHPPCLRIDRFTWTEPNKGSCHSGGSLLSYSVKISAQKLSQHLYFWVGFAYNAIIRWQPPETTAMTVPRWFITADKILISIHCTAKTIWVIKIIRTAGAISSKQNCLRCKSLQRVGISLLIKKCYICNGFSDYVGCPDNTLATLSL